MYKPQVLTVKQMQSVGVKIILYPELFTNALSEGAVRKLRHFKAKGEVLDARLVPNPHVPEDLGGLRALLGRDGGNAVDIPRR